MKYGIEVEMIHQHGYLTSDQLSFYKKKLGDSCGLGNVDSNSSVDDWSLGRDSNNLIELRSPVFAEFNFPLWKRIIEFLHKDCYTSPTCGIHIHFSDIVLSEEQLNSLKKRMWTIGKPKPNRRHFCNKGGYHPKYQAVSRIVDNHYECRVFNSCLNVHGIHNMWKQLNKELNVLS